VRAAVVLLALALAGCGGGGREHGTATLWVTRDRGAHVVYAGTVPAGLTAMQALERRLHVDTRYGGRFVQSIAGVHGSLTKERDWFWFVNGIEGDRSAAEYRLHPGDVEWWDYRSWSGGSMSVPVVVGAFPEPFLHGYGGKRPPVTVVADDVGLGVHPWVEKLRLRYAKLLHASPGFHSTGYAFLIGPWNRPFHASREGGRIVFDISYRDAYRLLDDPTLARFHYQGLR
jgi:hypothetical protein